MQQLRKKFDLEQPADAVRTDLQLCTIDFVRRCASRLKDDNQTRLCPEHG